ncbi:MAG: citrate (Si)-synthase [Bacteroidetes bacterium]|nr:citrate (Si)-synthase [Bacteroidota bacterium]
MDKLKERFYQNAQAMVADIKAFQKENADKKVGEYNVSQIYGGMHGIIGLITETSKLDPEEGIRFRGYTIPELREKLPRAQGGFEPLPEGIFYLMLMNDLPTFDDVMEVSNNWARRAIVPKHVFTVIDAMPLHTHPMTLFSMAIEAMQTESEFTKAYRNGIAKKDYWDPTYEDVMNLIARLPRVAAYIYRRLYREDKHIEPDPKLDWAANYAHMLGYDTLEVKRLMRLYLTIHADHEGGNVSAHSAHLVGSALSDAYLSYAAGMNGLAGPLHGLANQEVILWIKHMQKDLDCESPTNEQISQYVKKTMAEGKVIPGYGHAVLRKTDPRFTAQMDFAKKYIGFDPVIDLVHRIYEVVPPILGSIGKIKNPWPNVDAHSGALLMHYGINEYDYYTVMFGVSRALGVLAQLIWSRLVGLPIERPGSITTDLLKKKVATSTQKPVEKAAT